MMSALWTFWGLVMLMTITPGIDTAVVIRSVITRGRRGGVLAGIGCGLGLFVHAAAVAVGAAALLQVSNLAFEILKILGAVYLIVLGVITWRQSIVSRRAGHDSGTGVEGTGSSSSASPPRKIRNPMLVGLTTNLTNPKAPLFFLSLLPQFLPSNPIAALPVALALAIVPVVTSCAWLSVVALGLNKVLPLLVAKNWQRLQERIIGTVFIGLGIWVTVE